jgi:hypothetical protein
MGILAERLLKVGLLSEEKFQKQRATEELDEEQKSKTQLAQLAQRKGKQTGCEELDNCATMYDFKLLAKQILLRDPSKIRIVIEKAHRFKNDNQGKRFVRFFYKLRDGLKDLPAAKREQFLDKAFRRHGSTFVVSNGD